MDGLGSYPRPIDVIGVSAYSDNRLATGEQLTMGNIFKGPGYDTAYIGKWHLDGHGRANYIPPERRQGWDYWKVLECTHEYTKSYYYAGNDPTKKLWDGYDAYAQTDDAIAYINDHKDEEKPFILFMGYGGPHFPHHNAPPELMELYPPESIELRPNLLFDRLDYWRNLQKQGFNTVPEMPEPSRSDCHAWGAHPRFHAVAGILGIRPSSPQFASVRVQPMLGPLKWAKGTWPHPLGDIRVSLEQQGDDVRGTIELPEGLTGELILNGTKKPLTSGTMTW